MELNASNNEITTISPEAFSGLADLRTLDLSSNQITSPSEGGVWKGLESLWELDLSHNRLDAMSAEVRPQPKRVQGRVWRGVFFPFFVSFLFLILVTSKTLSLFCF